MSNFPRRSGKAAPITPPPTKPAPAKPAKPDKSAAAPDRETPHRIPKFAIPGQPEVAVQDDVTRVEQKAFQLACDSVQIEYTPDDQTVRMFATNGVVAVVSAVEIEKGGKRVQQFRVAPDDLIGVTHIECEDETIVTYTEPLGSKAKAIKRAVNAVPLAGAFPNVLKVVPSRSLLADRYTEFQMSAAHLIQLATAIAERPTGEPVDSDLVSLFVPRVEGLPMVVSRAGGMTLGIATQTGLKLRNKGSLDDIDTAAGTANRLESKLGGGEPAEPPADDETPAPVQPVTRRNRPAATTPAKPATTATKPSPHPDPTAESIGDEVDELLGEPPAQAAPRTRSAAPSGSSAPAKPAAKNPDPTDDDGLSELESLELETVDGDDTGSGDAGSDADSGFSEDEIDLG